jgi:hypothetical protein
MPLEDFALTDVKLSKAAATETLGQHNTNYAPRAFDVTCFETDHFVSSKFLAKRLLRLDIELR